MQTLSTHVARGRRSRAGFPLEVTNNLAIRAVPARFAHRSRTLLALFDLGPHDEFTVKQIAFETGRAIVQEKELLETMACEGLVETTKQRFRLSERGRSIVRAGEQSILPRL